VSLKEFNRKRRIREQAKLGLAPSAPDSNTSPGEDGDVEMAAPSAAPKPKAAPTNRFSKAAAAARKRLAPKALASKAGDASQQVPAAKAQKTGASAGESDSGPGRPAANVLVLEVESVQQPVGKSSAPSKASTGKASAPAPEGKSSASSSKPATGKASAPVPAPAGRSRNSTSTWPSLEGTSETEHMQHWLLFELAKSKPICSNGALLEIGFANIRHSLWKPKSPNNKKSLKDLCEDFIRKHIFTSPACENLKGWCKEVLDALPGESAKSTDKKFLSVLKNIYGSPKTFCEVLEDGTPAFHLQHGFPNPLASIALVVCALQWHNYLDPSMRVYYNTGNAVARISKGLVERKHLVYGIGYPGSGKSSAFRKAFEGMEGKDTSKTHSFPMVGYDNGMFLLGVWRDGLNPGTDAMEQAVKPKVMEWMRTCSPGFVVAEGIRLANRAFFDGARSMGYSVHIVLIDIPSEVSKDRYIGRGSVLDKNKELWYKGVCTQVDNMKDLVTKKIDGTQAADIVGTELKEFLASQFATVNNIYGDWSEEERQVAFAAPKAPAKPKPKPEAKAKPTTAPAVPGTGAPQEEVPAEVSAAQDQVATGEPAVPDTGAAEATAEASAKVDEAADEFMTEAEALPLSAAQETEVEPEQKGSPTESD